jgi:hypothetical protein
LIKLILADKLNSILEKKQMMAGMNFLNNHFYELNNVIPLDWFYMSINHFKKSCKNLFLTNRAVLTYLHSVLCTLRHIKLRCILKIFIYCNELLQRNIQLWIETPSREISYNLVFYGFSLIFVGLRLVVWYWIITLPRSWERLVFGVG